MENTVLLKYLEITTDLKIIFLNYQNNYVGFKLVARISKLFAIVMYPT